MIIFFLFLFTLILLLMVNKGDITAPPVVMCAAWLFPFVVTIFFEKESCFWMDSWTGMISLIGVWIFCFGYFSTKRKIYKEQSIAIDTKEIGIASSLVYIIIVLEAVALMATVFIYWKYIKANFVYNAWYSLKIGQREGKLNDSLLLICAQNVSRVFSIYLIIWVLSKQTSKQIKCCLAMQICMSLVFSIISGGRTAIFFLIISWTFTYLFLRKDNTKKVMKIVGAAIILLVGLFLAINALKYVYSTDKSGNIIAPIIEYALTPVLALEKWLENPRKEYGYGVYSFRFVLAVLNKMGFNVPVKSLVEPFVKTTVGYGNVYTFYKWYANDFGIGYAMLMQYFVGAIHGKLYQKMSRERSAKYIFWNAVLSYPLVMQFFQDQYLSLTSTWVQMYLSYMIFFVWLNRKNENR